MRKRSKSIWRNRAYHPCRRQDQRKWCVLKIYAQRYKHTLSRLADSCIFVWKWTVDVICDWLLQTPIQKRKKPGTQRKRRFKTHNDHLNGVLEDYSEGVPSKKWHTHTRLKRQDWYLCDVCISDLIHKDMQTHTHTHTLELYWVTQMWTDCKYFVLLFASALSND